MKAESLNWRKETTPLSSNWGLKPWFMSLRWICISSGRKKNEDFPKVIDKVIALKEEENIPYHMSALTAGVSYPTLMRWKGRHLNGETLIDKPGTKKTEPFELGKLQDDMALLHHGKKRTAGTTALYRKYSGSVSRRDINAMVIEARYNENIFKKNDTSEITWYYPGTVWSFDDSEFKHEKTGNKIVMDNIQDLASQYKFTPLSGDDIPCGEEIAGHLSMLFDKHGAPLFMKRDNGGNLNHQAVDDVLNEHMVLPLNSPGYYPQYNGAIEHTQGEMKQELDLKCDRYSTGKEMELCAEIAAHDLNHKPRRSLDGQHSCQVFFGPSRLVFYKKQRKEVYDWISDLALEIQEKGGNSVLPGAAWRAAVKSWLQKNRHISVVKKGKV